jgi:hypothetical protein
MSQGYSGPPQSSGGGSTVLVIVLVVAGVLGLGCLGVCGLAMLGVSWGTQQVSQAVNNAGPMIEQALKQSMLQLQAQAAVESNLEVREKLGEPLSFGTVTNPPPAGGDTTSFDFQVTGSKDKGDVHVEGRREGTDWKISMLQVRLSDGSAIDVNIDQPFNIPLDSEPTPVLPVEITDPPQSPDPVPGEPTP